MRILAVIPHYFGAGAADTVNKSRQPAARGERVQALAATIAGLHQVFGTKVYGLDHGQQIVWQVPASKRNALDVVVCTAGNAHLLDEIEISKPLFRHHNTRAEPLMLGFEAHKVLRDARGGYDYYCYIEDDIVIGDPSFFRKREKFDRAFGPEALLQPNRYEISSTGPIHKLYVDYRMHNRMTKAYQDITDIPALDMKFAEERIVFERTPYPSAGSFFLNAEQLQMWIKSRFFLDGDTSYMSPLNSAATLSVMKTFRIYKPALENASFLEVLHASPRWVGWIANQVKFEPLK